MKNLVTKLATAVVVVGVGFCGTAVAREGDLSTLFPVNDDDPKASIPTEQQREESPVEFGYWLQDMILRAEEGFENDDLERAVKYYEALSYALPHNPTSFRKLCKAQQKLGNLTRAEATCWAVLKREGALVYDHYHFLDLAIPLVGPSVPEVKKARAENIDSSLERLRALALVNAEHKQIEEYKHRDKNADKVLGKVDPAEQGSEPAKELPLATQIEIYACQLAAQLADPQRLARCVDGLNGVKADPKVVAMFNWAAKAAAKDEEGQKHALEEAKKLGLPEAALNALMNPKSVPIQPKPAVTTLPDDLLPKAVAPEVPELAPAPSSNVVEAPKSFDVEAIVAAIAALLGVGAGGFLLFKQLGSKVGLKRRQDPTVKPS